MNLQLTQEQGEEYERIVTSYRQLSTVAVRAISLLEALKTEKITSWHIASNLAVELRRAGFEI